MKRIFLLLFILITISIYGYDLEMNGNELTISGNAEELVTSELTVGLGSFTVLEMENCQIGDALGMPSLPHFSSLVSLGDRGNWKLQNIDYGFREFDLEYPVLPVGWEDLQEFNGYRGNEWYPQDIVTVGNPQIMRDYRFSQITIAAVQYNPALNKIRVIDNLNISLQLDESIDDNIYTGKEMPSSRVFDKLARETIFGYDGHRSDSDYNGSLLIICRSSTLTYVQYLAEWKRQKGFHTVIATTGETGSTTTSIKNYIEEAYEEWDLPPDYVLIIGDESGSYSIPAFYCEGYMYSWDVTDHDYTLLSGDDYFPDVLLGRISIRSSSHLQTAVSKVINYESDPYINNTNWYTKGLMISVVDDGWGQEYYSGRETVICAGEKLLDFTYTQVDTFIAPDQSSASQLRNQINTGYTFLNYRGFGSTYYWSGAYGGHMFEISDINALSNGWMLPMVTSIVCGGGDFATNNYSTCFGETWVVAGTSSSPKGGIAFIGPSEHDTKTPFNNCNDLGIYQGITQEGINGASAMMLRGKMEMYNNYPYCHSWGDATNSDQFYFYVYNLLGDPTLEVWTDVPKSCELTLAEEIPQGQNYIEVNISSEDNDVEDFCITILENDELITIARTNQNGNAYIPANLSIGDYTVTASRYGYIPAQSDFQVVSDDNIGFSDYSTSTIPAAGETFELDILLHNYSSQNASAISINLLNYDNQFEIINGNAFLTMLPNGEEEQVTFQLSANSNWIDQTSGQIFFNISSSIGNNTGMIELEINSPEMICTEADINTGSGFLEPGVLSSVFLELENSGSISSPNMSAELISLDANAIVSASTSSYNSLSPGASTQNVSAFEILPADITPGLPATLQLNLSVNGTIVQTLPVVLTIGEVDETCPTFDSYGYMAIESDDEGNFTAPDYYWEEISPFAGGDGTYLNEPHMHETSDGWIDQVLLPFDFQYYGETFDRITICQNGYFSFGEAQTLFFRNKSLPSGYGPGGMVCPFWDDLTQGYVYYWYDEDNHLFYIEWKNMRSVYNHNQRQYVEVVLFDPDFYPTATGDGEILFLYQQVNNVDANDNYATVGIESPDKTKGLQITFANIYSESAHILQDEKAILFTPYVPETSTEGYGDVDANGTVEAFDASIILQYFVGIDPGAVAPIPWQEWRIIRGDVDGNGSVEAYDGSLVLQYFVGIIDEFPVEASARKRNLQRVDE